LSSLLAWADINSTLVETVAYRVSGRLSPGAPERLLASGAGAAGPGLALPQRSHGAPFPPRKARLCRKRRATV